MVTRASTTYGELIRVDPDSGAAAETLHPVPLGRLTLAEFKLWRNPQARREVIGQILNYAKELASWRYADLQREVSRTLKRKGNVLYELTREHEPAANEAEFVDNVLEFPVRSKPHSKSYAMSWALRWRIGPIRDAQESDSGARPSSLCRMTTSTRSFARQSRGCAIA